MRSLTCFQRWNRILLECSLITTVENHEEKDNRQKINSWKTSRALQHWLQVTRGILLFVLWGRERRRGRFHPLRSFAQGPCQQHLTTNGIRRSTRKTNISSLLFYSLLWTCCSTVPMDLGLLLTQHTWVTSGWYKTSQMWVPACARSHKPPLPHCFRFFTHVLTFQYWIMQQQVSLE